MCDAQLLRKLTRIFENYPEQAWAQELYCEFLSMCRTADLYNQYPEINSRQHYMECLKLNDDTIWEKAVQQNLIREQKK